MGVLSLYYVSPYHVTRAERWAKEDEDRRLRQAVARSDIPDATTVSAVGYAVWKAGEALGDAVSSSTIDDNESGE